jgi:hypothetical protein
MAKKIPSRRARPVAKSKLRSYLSQADVPSISLEQALRVPTAIAENYGCGTVTPLQLATALMIRPTSGTFRQLCGASIAYGLTQGGYNADSITIEDLGKRIARPLAEGDDMAAMREAFLRPRVLREFLTKYNGSPVPRRDIAENVLTDLGVPADRAADVYDLICDGADSVGFLVNIKERQYVDLNGVAVVSTDVTVKCFIHSETLQSVG